MLTGLVLPSDTTYRGDVWPFVPFSSASFSRCWSDGEEVLTSDLYLELNVG